MIKEYFIDGLLQIALILSVLNSEWQSDHGSQMFPNNGEHLNRGSTYQGESVVFLADFYYRNIWSSNYGSYINRKNVENLDIEDVIHRIHSLSQYRTFDRVETHISAFLLDGAAIATTSNNMRGSLVIGTDGESTSHQNIVNPHSRNGDEPTKEDMDLIDVLWRQDMDLSMSDELNMLNHTSRWQLEREQELILHEKQEEETLEQLVQQEVLGSTDDYAPHFINSISESWLTDVGSTLNTPEIVVNESLDYNEFFRNQNSLSRQLSLEGRWQDMMSIMQYEHVDGQHIDINMVDDSDNDINNRLDGSVNLWLRNDDALNFYVEENADNNVLIQNVSLASYSSTSLLAQEPASFSCMPQQQVNDDIATITFSNSSGQHPNVLYSAPYILNHPMNNILSNNSNYTENVLSDDLLELLGEHSMMSWNGNAENSVSNSINNNRIDEAEGCSETLVNNSCNNITDMLRQQINSDEDGFDLEYNTSLMSDNNADFVDFTNLDELLESFDVMDYKSIVREHLESDPAVTPIDNPMTPCYEYIEESYQHSDDGACGGIKTDMWDKFNVMKQEFYSLAEDENEDYQSNDQLLNHQFTNSTYKRSLNKQQQCNKHLKENGKPQQRNYRWFDVKQIQRDHNYPSTFYGSNFYSNSNSDYSDDKIAVVDGYENAKNVPNDIVNKKTSKFKNDEDDEDCKNVKVKNEKKQQILPSFRSRDDKRVIEMKIPFSLDEIIYCPVDRFNEMVTSPKYRLSDAQIQLIKDVRKRGKNKMAAQNCRKRKMDIIQLLEEEVYQLKKEREQVVEERRVVNRDVEMMRNKIEKLQKEIFKSIQMTNDCDYVSDAVNDEQDDSIKFGNGTTANKKGDNGSSRNSNSDNSNLNNIQNFAEGSSVNGYNRLSNNNMNVNNKNINEAAKTVMDEKYKK